MDDIALTPEMRHVRTRQSLRELRNTVAVSKQELESALIVLDTQGLLTPELIPSFHRTYDSLFAHLSLIDVLHETRYEYAWVAAHTVSFCAAYEAYHKGLLEMIHALVPEEPEQPAVDARKKPWWMFWKKTAE